MPELPEVERVRKGLSQLVVGKTIACVTVRYPKMIRTGVDAFKNELIGQNIVAVGRRGKYLLFYLTDWVLVSHLRMEGKYFYYPNDVPERKHAHVFLTFIDASTLVYEDVRKFGTMELLPKRKLSSYFQGKKLGPEPESETFDLEAFQTAVKQSKKPLKNLLLDQTAVVGLGNIYVDEVLYRAKLHPERRASTLTTEEIRDLHREILAVIAQAIALGGSTIRSYHNAFGKDGRMQEFHQVYGKAGEPCPRCGALIQKIKLAGRGTHFCPICQPKERKHG